jgi:hypothetical protein
MEVVIYNRITLLDVPATDPTVVCRKWCARRRLKVRQVVTEYSLRQRKLSKLISSARGKIVVTYSPFHFATATGILQAIPKLARGNISLVFVRENIALHAGSRQMKLLTKFCQLLEAISRGQKQETRRKGTLIAKFMNRQVGRDRLPEALIEEAKAHLRSGLSARAVVRAMNGRIGRTSVQRIAREIRAAKK